MKIPLTTFFILITFITAKAQSNLQKCYVSEIGFTFNVPADYKVSYHKNQDGYTSENPILEIKKSDSATQARIDITVSLLKVTDANTKLFDNMIPYIKQSILLVSADNMAPKLDTLFTKVKIDKQIADKISVADNNNSLKTSTSSYLGKSSGYYFNIGIFTNNIKWRNEIFALIEAGSFNN